MTEATMNANTDSMGTGTTELRELVRKAIPLLEGELHAVHQTIVEADDRARSIARGAAVLAEQLLAGIDPDDRAMQLAWLAIYSGIASALLHRAVAEKLVVGGTEIGMQVLEYMAEYRKGFRAMQATPATALAQH